MVAVRTVILEGPTVRRVESLPLYLFEWSRVPQDIDSHRADKQGDYLDRRGKTISPGEQTPKHPPGNRQDERPCASRKRVHALRPQVWDRTTAV
jgi:hypothetical protein